MDRKEALEELARLGIEGETVYLIDMIPLIEMIWADGQVQAGEITILDHWIRQQVQHLNQMAGYEMIGLADSIRFAKRFLSVRPDPDHLRKIRQCIGPVRLNTPGTNYGKKLLKRILSACMDIAASSVTEYPYGFRDRFNKSEKALFLDILATFRKYTLDAKAYEDV